MLQRRLDGLLLQQQSWNNDPNATEAETTTTTIPKRQPQHQPQPTTTFRQQCYDWLVYECNSVVPAVFSLIVHCLAHVGIFDGIGSIVEIVKTKLTSVCELEATYSLDIAFFIVGVLLMRLSSDLFWWLSDRTYECVKLDLHNRLRLGCWDARLLVWVRARPLVRVALFMTGFSLCYSSTMVLQSTYLKRPVDQREELLRHMPSVVAAAAAASSTKQTLARISYCSKPCHDEIERQGTCSYYFSIYVVVRSKYSSKKLKISPLFLWISNGIFVPPTGRFGVYAFHI